MYCMTGNGSDECDKNLLMLAMTFIIEKAVDTSIYSTRKETQLWISYHSKYSLHPEISELGLSRFVCTYTLKCV